MTAGRGYVALAAVIFGKVETPRSRCRLLAFRIRKRFGVSQSLEHPTPVTEQPSLSTYDDCSRRRDRQSGPTSEFGKTALTVVQNTRVYCFFVNPSLPRTDDSRYVR